MADEQPSTSSEQPPVRRPAAWRDGNRMPGPGRDPAAHRGKKIFGVLAVMACLIGAIIALILWFRPFHQPVFLTVAVTEYTEPHWPVNAWAQQDSTALAPHFPKSTRAFSSQELDALRRELEDLRKRVKAQESLVLHLSALAVTDGGAVYLLPARAHPDHSNTWLPLSEVLELVRKCPAKHKLLILDIMRPVADPRLGMLVNDVAEYTQSAVEAAVEQDPALLVLLACSPGQVSLASEDLGQSVLGYYLEEGLRGHADKYNKDRKPNGRVTALELAAFVKARVDRWAQDNRKTRQTPVLLGKGGDFQLVVLDPKHLKPAPGVALPKYPAALEAWWQFRDQWLSDEVYHVAPHALRKLEGILLRNEQRWLGGADETAIDSDLKKASIDLLPLVSRAKESLRGPTPVSVLALPGGRDMKSCWLRLTLSLVEETLAKALQGQLLKLEKPDKAEKEEPSKPQEKANKQAHEFLRALQGPPPFSTLARVVVNVAADDANLTPIKLHFLQHLLEAHPESRPFVETIFLRRLAELKTLDPANWPDVAKLGSEDTRKQLIPKVLKAIRLALQVVVAGEEVMTFDPRVLPWVASLLEKTDGQRRQAETQLFADAFGSTPRIEALLDQLQKAEQSYREINGHGEVFQDAYRMLDRAMTRLPGYVPYLDNPSRRDDRPEEALWHEAVRETVALQELLAVRGDDLSAKRSALQDKTAALQRLVGDKGRLHRPFLKENWDRLEEIDDIDALLASTWLRAEDHKPLWEKRRELAQERHKQTRRADEADNANEDRFTKEPDAFNSQLALERDRQRADRRARLSIALLKLGGLARAEELDKKRQEALKAATPEAWQTLAVALRKTWADLPQQLDQLLKSEDLRAADRLGRVLHPFDGDMSTERDPTRLLRLQEAEGLWTWLRKRYRQESQSPNAPAYYREFYEQAAEQYQPFSR